LGSKIKVGQIWTTNTCGELEIIAYEKWDNVTVRFVKTGTIKKTNTSSITKGCIKDHEAPTVHGVGVTGGLPSVCDGERLPYYFCWKEMLRRVYKCDAYKDVSVCEEWLDLRNFKVWFDEHYKDGYDLDKDILEKGNKIYSPDKCCFVPHSLNMCFVKCDSMRGESPIGVSYNIKDGVYDVSYSYVNEKRSRMRFASEAAAFRHYKESKEVHIKCLAEKHFQADEISRDVYDALLKYEVSIED